MPIQEWLNAIGLGAPPLPETTHAATPDPAGVGGFGPELSEWVHAFAHQAQPEHFHQQLLDDSMKWERRRLENPQRYWEFQNMIQAHPELMTQHRRGTV